MSLNKVFLIGNVGQEPKVTTFREGGKIANFTFATTERGFTTKEGRKIEDQTEWHNIVVKQTGLAGIVEKYVHKGSPLFIEGRIATRTYQDNSAQTRYVTEIIAANIQLLGAKPQTESNYQPISNDYPGA